MSSGSPSRRGASAWVRPWIVALAQSRYLPLVASVLAVLLASPSLGVGWVQDDYYHLAVLLPGSPYRELLGSPAEMFRFFRGDPVRTGRIMDAGLFPWWTDRSIKAEFLQVLTVLTHRLDYWFWPDSPALMHAQNLFWLGTSVAAVAVFYRRMVGPTWVAGLAAVLYAVDDARGPTVGFIANRNVLIAATFGVTALISHDRCAAAARERRRAWPRRCLPGLFFSEEEGLGTFAYLAAYAVFVDPAGRRRGCLALSPYLVVVVVWRGAARFLGLWRAQCRPLRRPADRHRSFHDGPGSTRDGLDARTMEPDPGGGGRALAPDRTPPCL